VLSTSIEPGWRRCLLPGWRAGLAGGHVGRRPFPFGYEASETAKLFITVTSLSFRSIGPLSTRSYSYFSFDPGKNETNDTNHLSLPISPTFGR
jgi:hypothetical protein